MRISTVAFFLLIMTVTAHGQSTDIIDVPLGKPMRIVGQTTPPGQTFRFVTATGQPSNACNVGEQLVSAYCALPAKQLKITPEIQLPGNPQTEQVRVNCGTSPSDPQAFLICAKF